MKRRLALATLSNGWEAHGGIDDWRAHQRIELELEGVVELPPARWAFGVETASPSVTLHYDPSVWGEGTMWLDEGGSVQERVLDPAAPDLLADSVRHLVEFTFSMDSADVLHTLPDVDGHSRLFASWGDSAPQRDIDQYILWFDAEHVLRRFDSTGRAIAPFIRAEVTFEDYRDAGGFLLPGHVEVRRPGPGGALVHAWTLREARLVR
ncbi:MAG: hypothetical protein GY913_10535 [Proteobacteria bacterium]|nr:hypothetical protein [Pseudomonadota bacterium]MCP4917350.1 hypothetical protein [Pseudomonadota bacterium]